MTAQREVVSLDGHIYSWSHVRASKMGGPPARCRICARPSDSGQPCGLSIDHIDAELYRRATHRADPLQLPETAGADDRRDNLATFGALCFGLGMIVGIIVWAVVGR